MLTTAKPHLSQATLDKLVAGAASKKHIYGATFQVASPDGAFCLTSASGNLSPNAPFYIASINKMLLAALALRLIREGQMRFTDRIAAYLPADLLQGLHVHKGVEYTGEITILHLLSQTSGLPCYLIDKRPDGPKVMEELLRGKDEAWPLERVVAQVKRMKTKFRPGQSGKASYGNTNFRLLGRILELVTGRPLDELLTSLFEELQLEQTFVIQPDEKRTLPPIYVKNNPVVLPRYFASSKYDVVSTTQDLMTFLKAFFNGHFYPKAQLQELERWNSIFFPFKYGIGLQKFYTPWLLSPFNPIPDMIGHCGSVGTAAFYVPEKDVFITGSINQTSSPSVLFQTMIRILNQL